MKIFVLTKKSGPFFTLFLSKIWPFLLQKSGFLDIFFETAHRICLKLGQNLGTIALDHRMTVLCLEKFLLWPFWSKIHCMWWHLYGFGLFLSFSFKALLFFNKILLFELCLWFRNEKWKALTKKFGPRGAIKWG